MQAWLNRILTGGFPWIRARGPWIRAQSPRLVSSLLGALIVLESTRMVLPLLPSPAPGAAHTAIRPSPPRVRGVDAQSIVEHHLFGVADADAAESDNPSISGANLILQGTIATEHPDHGIAIVTADGPAQVYKVGDGIGGATLDSVYMDRVTLKRGGRLETLALPRLLASHADEPPPPPVASNEEAPRPHHATPKSMGDLMGTDPATSEESGTFEGFRLHPGKTGIAFIRAGLRNGDIMTSVNGIPLANQNQKTSQDLVNTMLGSDHAVVSVLRNGKPVDISVDLGR